MTSFLLVLGLKLASCSQGRKTCRTCKLSRLKFNGPPSMGNGLGYFMHTKLKCSQDIANNNNYASVLKDMGFM
jgi:hypothetical protein